MGNNFVRPIEPINRLIHTQYKLQHQYTKNSANCKHSYMLKIERFLAKKGVLFSGVLGLNTLCRGCSNHMTFVGLLHPLRDKSEKVCTCYKV